jgi:hypothetical protein
VSVALAALMACFAAESASARVVQTIGTTGELRLRTPVDVAVGPSGSIYVLDTGDRASSQVLIKVYLPAGRLVRHWRVGRPLEHGGVPFMALDPAGNTYVGASGFNTILRYSPAGQLSARWQLGDGQLDYPFSFALDGDGHLLAAEGNGRIETFDAAGRLLASWQRSVRSLAVATSGTIYIADRQGIATLDPSGSLSARLVPAGRRPGQVFYPRLVAGPAGSVYAAQGQRIQKFASDGRFLGSVGLDRRVQTLSAAVANDGSIYAPQWSGLYRGVETAVLKLAPIASIDVTPPSIKVRAVSSPALTPRRARVLARLTYGLSEDASFRVSLMRRAATSDRGNPYFGRYLYRGTIDVRLTPAGRHTLVLDWRSFGYERPVPGHYRLNIVARDDAGNESRPARVAFSVQRR